MTPLSRSAFIIGKSLLGMVAVFIMSALSLLITGFVGINFWQAALVIFTSTILSMMIGFAQGVSSSDVMEAAGSVKLIFLPLAGSVVGYELVAENWQVLFYWSPYYWAYRANDMILSQSGSWPQLLLSVAVILVVCAAVYAVVSPRVKKGLQ